MVPHGFPLHCLVSPWFPISFFYFFDVPHGFPLHCLVSPWCFFMGIWVIHIFLVFFDGFWHFLTIFDVFRDLVGAWKVWRYERLYCIDTVQCIKLIQLCDVFSKSMVKYFVIDRFWTLCVMLVSLGHWLEITIAWKRWCSRFKKVENISDTLYNYLNMQYHYKSYYSRYFFINLTACN